MDVKVEVTSNELQQETMVRLFEQQVSGFVEQAKVYFSATRCVCVLYMCVMIQHFCALFSHFEQIPNCFYFTFYYPCSCGPHHHSKSSKSNRNCEKDPSIDLKIRFYEITVTGTDSAGRQGSDTCRIIMVPKCKHDHAKYPKSPGKGQDPSVVPRSYSPGICEHYDYHHDRHHDHYHSHNDDDDGNNDDYHDDHHHTSSKHSSKSNPHRDYPYHGRHVHGHYYKLDYLVGVVKQSDYRYKIAEADLVWEDMFSPPEHVDFDNSTDYMDYDEIEMDDDGFDDEDGHDEEEDGHDHDHTDIDNGDVNPITGPRSVAVSVGLAWQIAALVLLTTLFLHPFAPAATVH